jgi:hypothetical protein
MRKRDAEKMRIAKEGYERFRAGRCLINPAKKMNIKIRIVSADDVVYGYEEIIGYEPDIMAHMARKASEAPDKYLIDGVVSAVAKDGSLLIIKIDRWSPAGQAPKRNLPPMPKELDFLNG